MRVVRTNASSDRASAQILRPESVLDARDARSRQSSQRGTRGIPYGTGLADARLVELSLQAAVSALLLGAGTGLLSSLHCVAMCGPLVALGCGPTQRPASLWLLGRGTAYVGAGALSAGMSGALGWLAGGGVVGSVVSVLLALLLLGTGYRWLRPSPLVTVGRGPSSMWLARASERVRRGAFSPVLLGALSVVLPCGALWSALAAAIATGRPLLGALVMLAFAVASSPALYLSGAVARTPDPWVRRGIGVLLCLGAVISLARPLLAYRGASPVACHEASSVSPSSEVEVGSAP